MSFGKKNKKYIVVANWKMNTNSSEFSDYFSVLEKNIPINVDVVICPPIIYLKSIKDLTTSSKLLIGAQNIWHKKNGEYTGEISVEMVKEYASYVIVGHSERREYFNESDYIISKKVKAVTDQNLNAILCIGESFDQRENNKYIKFIQTQLKKCLENVSNFEKVIIAYEPIWAIGTGKVATATQINEMLDVINSTLKDIFPEVNNKILYGGSITENNIKNYAMLSGLEGVLVGKSSTKIKSFTKIIKSFEKK